MPLGTPLAQQALTMSNSSRFSPFLVGLLLLACGGPLKFQMASTPKAPGSDAKLVAAVHEDQHQTEIEFESVGDAVQKMRRSLSQYEMG